MVNLMVVEDEPPILRSICRMIESVDHRFHICATAYDGQEALEALATVRPDVIFTDIAMPYCDGVALMKAVSEQYPEIAVVVLSGYADFSYAQSAISYGATEYLLKPLEEAPLAKVLNRLYDSIAVKQRQKQQEVLRQILMHTKSGRIDNPEDWPQKNLYALLLCAGPLPYHEDSFNLSANSVWDTLSCETILRSYYPNLPFLLELRGKTPPEQLLFVTFPDIRAKNSICRHLFSALNQQPTPVSVYLYGPIQNICEFPSLFRQLRREFYHCIQFGTPRFFTYGELPKKENAYFLPSEVENLLMLSIHQDDTVELQRTISSIFKKTEFQVLSQANLERVLNQILMAVQKGFSLANESGIDLYSILYASTDHSSLERELLQAIQTFSQNARKKQPQREDILREIDSFIQNNLSSPLTNQALSDRFGLSPSYISKLFKQQYGLSPMDYLQKLRIAYSKKLLLSSDNLKSKDIAQIVGYSDALYFSRVFKNETGMSPTHFKKMHESNASSKEPHETD